MANFVETVGVASGRVHNYPGDLCHDEVVVLLAYPSAVTSFKSAREKADVYTDQFYSAAQRETDNIPANAFKHAIWNTLMCKYYGEKIDNKNQAIDVTAQFANAHEQCNIDRNQGGPDNMHVHMDYRNNYIGRSYFSAISYIKEHNYLLFKTYELVVHSDDIIKNTLKSKADQAACICISSMQCVWQIPNYRMIYLSNYGGIQGYDHYCY